MRGVDTAIAWGRKIAAVLAPDHSKRALARKQISLMAALLAIAAIAGAMALKPARHPQPDGWVRFKQQVRERAQIDLFDDFRSGLDAWQKGADAPARWSYDKSGLVTPGGLSFFAPSMSLTNYDVDALLQIESKGVGLAFRAEGPRTYQAVRLLLEGSGPMRAIEVQRYFVAGGKRSRPVLVRSAEQFDADALYHVRLQVQGEEVALYVQGRLVDYWSDHRTPTGGIGLFCGPGERARVAWIRVSHNTDSLGRVCSLLASVL